MSTAPQPQPSMDAALRVVRIIHRAMLASAVLYVFVGELVAADSSGRSQVDSMLVNVSLILAITLALAAIGLRQKLTASTQEMLLRSPGDAATLGRWRAAHVVAFALAEAVVLFGLVLRIMGATLTQAATLYAMGIIALLLISPRRL
jgi:hypothetical protein